MKEMLENDFLKPVLSLNPIAFAFLVWFWGFGSLALIASRTDSITNVLLQHPGFMVGDFFLLPLTGLLVAYFYQNAGATQSFIASRMWAIGGAIVATILTLVSILRNDLTYVWFVPHGAFYWFMAYVLITFFPKALLHLVLTGAEKRLWFFWYAALLASSAHLLIPMFYGPKILPEP